MSLWDESGGVQYFSWVLVDSVDDLEVNIGDKKHVVDFVQYNIVYRDHLSIWEA